MSKKPLDPVVEEAIDWMVYWRSGTLDADQQARFDQWLANPIHAQAWHQLQKRLNPYAVLRDQAHQLPPKEARQLLLQSDQSRRNLLRGFVGLGVLGGGLWVVAQTHPVRALYTDLTTGIGERRQFHLADGSQLSLNAVTGVDIAFDEQQRLLILREGELVVQVASDPSRPFRVRSAQGDITALGTRFLVRQEAQITSVVVLEHSVRVSLPNGVFRDVQRGEAVLLHAHSIEFLGTGQNHRADWLEGRLSVLNEPLSGVIDRLRAYRVGLIRVAPEVRSLRVQGVYPLDDTERTLRALAETLPIRVERYTPWLVLIGPR